MSLDRGKDLLIPERGTWVTDSDIQKAIGQVEELRPDETGIRIRVKWLKPKDRGSSWHDLEALAAGFMSGQEVRHLPPSVRASELGEGVVQHLRSLGGRDQVLVDFPEAGALKWVPFQYLVHHVGVHQRFVRGMAGEAGEAEKLRLRNLAYVLELWNENTGSLSHLNIDPLPHQIHLVHRILRSGNLNWMVADDVGLGKTIEIGMLLSALQQRGNFRRILIVTPPGVMIQWQEEMREKFGLDNFLIYGRDFEVHDSHHWKLYDHVIGSMDRFKGDDHRESLLLSESWDLVIFDEAHRLSRRQYGRKYESSRRFQLAAKLRARTDALLLLTATPHQGMQDRFHALLELLRPDRKRQIQTLELNPHILRDMIIRNNKADVTDAEGNFIFKGKTTKAISVDVSGASKNFDRELQHYVRQGYQAAARLGRQGIAVGFVMTIYRKLASSSIAAIHQALVKRRRRLEEEVRGKSEEVSIWAENGDLPLQDQRYQGEFEEMAAGGQARQFFEGELTTLDELIQKAGVLLGEDRKLQSFMEQLIEIVHAHHAGEKILVFTEYRATQSYLERALTGRFGEHTVELIHGGQNYDERRQAIARFEDTAQFLISTEAGGEGINLQRRCHVMVNYDLPWNPMRLVQRIGRIYRYGQQKHVIVFNVHAPETIDASIVQTMYVKLMQIARDMAVLGREFQEGLEDEILGEMANLMELDISDILTNAATEEISRTQERINDALKRAHEASSKQRELFAHVSGYDPNEIQGELRVTSDHVRAFVEGMLPRLGIDVVRLHGGMLWELRIPDNLREDLPRFSTRQRVTLDRTWAAERRDVHMLDMESPLMRLLLKYAKDTGFGGRAAMLRDLSGNALLTGILRWQNNHGIRMRQEFIALQLFEDGRTVINSDAFSRWLLGESSDSTTTLTGKVAKSYFERAEALTDRRLGLLANTDLQPENRQWVSAGWLDG